MKTKQRPTAAAAANAANVGASAVSVGIGAGSAVSVSRTTATTARPRNKEEEPIRQRQRQPQTQCERERKHEAARKEREAQAQLKRKSTPTLTPAAQRMRTKTLRMPSKEAGPTTVKQAKAKPKTIQAAGKKATTITTTTTKAVRTIKTTKAAATAATFAAANVDSEETAQLRLQLEHLAQLSQQDFEREFRTWMAQEGIEGKVQAQVRMDLINSFNNTSLGKLLRKASVSASATHRDQRREPSKKQCNVLSPLTLALHTLVAEFLYVHNCHYTLSVFTSEMPQRHTLPDFESRPEYRFSQEELQQLIKAILGEHNEVQLQFSQTVMRVYGEQPVSLLLGIIQVLLDLVQGRSVDAIGDVTTTVCTLTQREESTQTQPGACLQSRPDVDTSRLFQAKELVVAADGRTVFVGPRVSQSLLEVDQQLVQLMQNMQQLCKSCAPPVEIISQPAFEQLLQQELLERQRLLSAGQHVDPGKTALQLPAQKSSTGLEQQQHEQQEGNTVLSPAGPIQLPSETASVPKLPQLHEEQVASLAMVQQALQQLQEQVHQPQDCMYVTLERMEALVGELAGCIQTLSNVLNLAMEQEYAVGRHKGFKVGYREGFSHGHFMGIQEGMQSMEQKLRQEHAKTTKLPEEHKQKRDKKIVQLQLKDSSTQTASQCPPASAPCPLPASLRCPPPVIRRTVGCQTPHTHQRSRTTSTDRRIQAWKHSGSQTTARKEVPSVRSYEQWIYEMLHSSSGQIFLERVELSLNKALELQKKRLDELFDVKLRHHAELMRLSSRQNSWRTLCRHVERDSQSIEARDLVHKIFRLLEHYEAHHQLLAEKIQQTEQAAQQAAHIEPVWRNPVTPASAASKSPPGTAATSDPSTAPRHPPATAHNSLPMSFPTLAPVAAPAQLVVPASASVPTPVPVHLPIKAATAASIAATTASTSAPAVPLTPTPLSLSAPIPSADASSSKAVLPTPAPTSTATPALAPTVQPPTMLTPSTCTVAPSTESPGKPIMLNAATNTQLMPSLILADARVQTTPSFTEALLCAKNRMLQLEQESDLLEKSFLGYLERARAQKQRPNLNARCAREHQQFQQTLDSFQDWQATQSTLAAPVTAPAPSASPVPATPAPTTDISPTYSASELEPESYQFTNAIAVARHKLLSELQATAVQVATPAEFVRTANRLLVDQVQDETQELLSRVEATLARVSKPASLQLLTAESQLQSDLDQLSSTPAQSSLEKKDTPPASRKLQRSMAKMQLLFGNQTQETTTAKRPWSAPINKMKTSLLPPTRPHTAPSSLTEAVTPAGNLQGLLDALSDVGDSTTNTSSLTSSLNHVNRNALEVLANGCSSSGSSSGTLSHSSFVSPALSPSQEFWKRMNM